MGKRPALSLPDETHALIEARAAEAGVSAHAWLVAAVEREAFRQLCEKTDKWWQAHPDEARAEVAAYHRRQSESRRGSSAA
ncbi:hypothetical protein FHX82_005937 [Amycolatopsis bartoniae]|uniref:Uncharacterized protein n=1 Tax=Amycolatopsis bartoniae TaxID=941986 RepID=A0A8H9MG45_9PSEU|nr:hypothetical protein [Amycolatopsis bartoniae]MBB2938859.1 hypothetical protein [Amycolatopsis bartoniae]TVT00691.1 hypothetical protein FNH07_31210 [Amycolatopsis bartoniae]GHF77149.1 hypothetical protein GCM10017566_59180 [Amycolatopsis bartoniae]